MQSQPEGLKDEPPPYPESPTSSEPPLPLYQRNKGPARCYYVLMAVLYAVLLLMAIVALASFGIKQSEINKRQQTLGHPNSETCILFSKYIGTDEDPNGNPVYRIRLHTPGLCGYVLWGLTSITIVAFVWLIYSIVLAVVGPKIISLLRFVDLVMMALTALLSFSLSVTITAGMNETCSHNRNHRCGSFIQEGSVDKLEFYGELNTAKSSSWVTTVLLIALSIWYFIALFSYFCIIKHRRKLASQYAHMENDVPAAV